MGKTTSTGVRVIRDISLAGLLGVAGTLGRHPDNRFCDFEYVHNFLETTMGNNGPDLFAHYVAGFGGAALITAGAVLGLNTLKVAYDDFVKQNVPTGEGIVTARNSIYFVSIIFIIRALIQALG